MKAFVISFIILLNFHCTSAEAQIVMSDTIVFGSDVHYPPYEFINGDGKPDGLNIELMQAIADEMGFNIKFKLGNWTEIRKELEHDGTVHVSDMFYSKSRDKFVDYAIPHEVAYDQIYVRKDHESIFTIDDLNGKRVAAQNASTIFDYLIDEYPGIELIGVPNEIDAILKLVNNECDAAIVSRIIDLEQVGESKLESVVVIGKPLLPRELGFVVKEGNHQLLRQINIGLLRMQESGKIEELKEKWTKPKDTYKLTKKFILIGFGMLLIIFIVFNWNRALQVIVKKKTRQLETTNKRLKLISSIQIGRIDKFTTKEHTIALLEHVKETFEVDVCIARTMHNNELILIGGVGIDPTQLTRIASLNIPSIKKTMQNKKATGFPSNEIKLSFQPSFENTKSYISHAIAPFVIDDKITGLLEIFLEKEDRFFTDEDLEHLQLVANQIGVSIENMRLYDQNEKHKEVLVRQIISRKKAEEANLEQLTELRRWYEATIDREERIIDLKKEVNELLQKSNEIKRYDTDSY